MLPYCTEILYVVPEVGFGVTGIALLVGRRTNWRDAQSEDRRRGLHCFRSLCRDLPITIDHSTILKSIKIISSILMAMAVSDEVCSGQNGADLSLAWVTYSFQ